MKLINKIKKSNLGQYAISQWHCLLSWIMPKLYNDEKAIKKYYKRKSKGKKIDLNNPVLFSEKIQWYKLNDRKEIMKVCADKYGVRKYLVDLGYGDLLNDLYGVYSKVEDIKWELLPNKFVMKAAHGSGQNIIVKNKEQINYRHVKRMLKSWLHQDIAWSGREWVYKHMPKNIIIEKFLEDENGELRDYKFFCFNGKPTFMQLEVGRYTNKTTRNFYDMEWNLLPFGKELPHNPNIIIDIPPLFDEMKKIAEELSKPFQFVRVDLYQVHNKVYFGEFTFFPAGGAPDFVPCVYDEIVGNFWKLQKNEE